jgi:hypothetical protein
MMQFQQRFGTQPIDALALLQRDHIRVLLLVNTLRALPAGSTEREASLLQLSRALAVHATVEEKTLYAELRDGAATREKVLDVLKHHERIHELLFDLVVTPPDEAAWQKTFAELDQVIARYVAHEEAEIFPVAREVISPWRRRRMTRDVLAEQRRLTRSISPAASRRSA